LIVSKGQKVFYKKIAEIEKETPRTLNNFRREMDFFEIADSCELLDIMDIGNQETMLILANEQKRIVFYQIKEFNHSDSRTETVNVQLVKLGLQDHELNNKHQSNEKLS
jgi:hypothetical protein